MLTRIVSYAFLFIFAGDAIGKSRRDLRALQGITTTEHTIRAVLSNSTFATEQACYDTTWITTADDYKNGKWSNILPPAFPLLLYPFCADMSSLGNIIGNYVNEVSCAMISGAHFGMNRKPYHLHLLKKHLQGNPLKFFETFPEIVVNENPLDDHTVQVNLNESCKCYHYCWGEHNAPWEKNIPWIKKTLHSAVDAFMQTVNIEDGTQLNPATDNSSHSFDKRLPMIPDVTIHYRCGDNLRFDTIGYGLLPFHVMPNLIPSDTQFILIISDSVKRLGDLPQYDYHSHCSRILGWLQDYLTVRYRNATVVVKRGGSPLVDFARIAYSKTAICSASTFCFFAALASNGSVYFPVTRLVSRVEIGSNFHWVDEKLLSLVIWHPWYSIEYGLTKKDFNSDWEQEGRLMKGDRNKFYFIEYQKKRYFPDGDTMDALGFDWRHVWHVNDKFLRPFPDGIDMRLYPDKTIKYQMHPVTYRWYCTRCYNLTYAPSPAPSVAPSVLTSILPDLGTNTFTNSTLHCRWKTAYEFSCD